MNHDTKANSPIVVPVPPLPDNATEETKPSITEDTNMNVASTGSPTKAIPMIKEETIEEKLQSIIFSLSTKLIPYSLSCVT